MKKGLKATAIALIAYSPWSLLQYMHSFEMKGSCLNLADHISGAVVGLMEVWALWAFVSCSFARGRDYARLPFCFHGWAMKVST